VVKEEVAAVHGIFYILRSLKDEFPKSIIKFRRLFSD